MNFSQNITSYMLPPLTSPNITSYIFWLDLLFEVEDRWTPPCFGHVGLVSPCIGRPTLLKATWFSIFIDFQISLKRFSSLAWFSCTQILSRVGINLLYLNLKNSYLDSSFPSLTEASRFLNESSPLVYACPTWDGPFEIG